MTHNHVVAIHAIEESSPPPFIVMEYIVGVSLQQRIKATGPLKVNEILRIGMQIADGLDAAHAQGVVHRDIKPSNILLENGVERVKITDFGLARARNDAQLTQTGVVAGTPEYMSPEQAEGRKVGHRGDLFSLGCVLYAMSTGRSPFRASSAVQAIRRVCDDMPRPISEVNPDIPAFLINIIDHLLEKDPDDRFQTAKEVHDLLGSHLAQRQGQSVSASMLAVPKAKKGKSRKTPDKSGMLPWKLGAASLTALLLIVGLAIWRGPWSASRKTAAGHAPHERAVLFAESEGGNDHWYLAVLAPGGVTWEEANERAKAMGGHLVTISSAAENDFVLRLINDPNYWQPASDTGLMQGPWIGAFQVEGVREPDGGWRWVTGEPFVYSNWKDIQPNDTESPYLHQQWVFYHASGDEWLKAQWGDASSGSPGLRSFLVEFNTSPVVDKPTSDPYASVVLHPGPKLTNIALTGDKSNLRRRFGEKRRTTFMAPGIYQWEIRDGEQKNLLIDSGEVELVAGERVEFSPNGHVRVVGPGPELPLAFPEHMHPVQIDDKANVGLNESPEPGKEWARFQGLEPGILQIGNLFFNLSKKLIHLGNEKNLPNLPREVKAIEVGRTAKTIHFLHSARWGGGRQGTVLGNYVVYYEDGTSETVAISVGQNAHDWLEGPNATNGRYTTEAVTHVLSNVEGGPGNTAHGLVFAYSWKNRHPEKLIKSIDFELGETQYTTPFCLAITLDEEETPGLQRGSIFVTIHDSQRVEIANALGETEFEFEEGHHCARLAPSRYTVTLAEGDDVLRSEDVIVRVGTHPHLDTMYWTINGRLKGLPCPRPYETIDGPMAGAFCMALSPHKDLLAVAGGNSSNVHTWRIENGEYVPLEVLHGHDCGSLSFSPGGEILVCGGKTGTVRLWDVESKTWLPDLTDHGLSVDAVVFSPDGKTLALGFGDGLIELWDWRTRQKRSEIIAHEGKVHDLTFSPDGSLLVSCEYQQEPTAVRDEGYLKVWDTNTLDLKWDLRGHTDSVFTVLFTKDGKTLVSTGRDTSVRFWDMDTGEQARIIRGRFRQHALALTPDESKVLVGSPLGTISVWEIESGEILNEFNAHWRDVRTLKLLDGETFLSCGADNQIHEWRLTDLPEYEGATSFQIDPLKVFDIERRWATCVAISPDGQQLALTYCFGFVQVWDLQTDRKIAGFNMRQGGQGYGTISSMAYTPNAKFLVTRGSWPTFLAKRNTARFSRTMIHQEEDRGGNLAISPDGQYAALNNWGRKSLDLVDLSTDELIPGPVFPELGKPWGPTFSPDGQTIALPTDAGRVVLVNVLTRRMSRPLVFDENKTRCSVAKYSPDGNTLLTGGGNGLLKLWDAISWEMIAELDGHEEDLFSAAYSPDGRYFVTSGGAEPLGGSYYWKHRGEVCIWDAETRELLLKFSPHENSVTGVCFSPDGKALATCGLDAKARLWNFAELLAAAETH